MSDKPRISYTDLAWSAAFARIAEGQRLSAGGVTYKAHWKHRDPDWLMLLYRSGKSRCSVMVRQGDPLLLELKCL